MEKETVKKREAKPTEVRPTPEFRVSFPHVFQKHVYEENEPKFSITMLFDKKTDITSLKRAVVAAATAEWGPKEKWPKNLVLPFRDGDEKSDLEGYEGMIYVSASSKNRPGVVNQKREPIVEEDGAFYAGCYARATLNAFAWSYGKAKHGVSFGLLNVQKLRDGESFSGRRNAEDDFDSVEDADLGDSLGADDDLGL